MDDVSLVLLPGLDGTGVMFRPLLRHLPSQLRSTVVRYAPDQPLGYEQLLPVVLGALPRSTPFILLGESFSGPLALMAAATRPAGLLGVILCATFVRNPAWYCPPVFRHLIRSIFCRSYSVATGMKMLLGRYATDELRALTREAKAPVRPAVLACRLRAVMKVNVLYQLRSCPVPVMYLRGDYDRVVPARNMRQIVCALPSVHVHRLAAPHMVLQTLPVESATAIAEFTRFCCGPGLIACVADASAVTATQEPQSR
jgi:pimeloyl-ACP methyl ester carboxylesterase